MAVGEAASEAIDRLIAFEPIGANEAGLGI